MYNKNLVNPVGKIAEKAVWRSAFCTQYTVLPTAFLAICPLGTS